MKRVELHMLLFEANRVEVQAIHTNLYCAYEKEEQEYQYAALDYFGRCLKKLGKVDCS